MKNHYLFIGAFICSLACTAGPIGKQAALYTAKDFMAGKGKSIITAQPARLRASAAPSSEESKGNAPLYVFNAGEDQGYVIVSGDDRTEPILGYVDQGSFDPDNIPEAMRAWMQACEEQINYIIDNNVNPSSPLLRRPSKAQTARHSIPDILVTRWGQGFPYNLTCPKYYTPEGNENYPAAGCVAIGMGQVVSHYRYPAQTVADIPAHTMTYTLNNGTKKTSTSPLVPAGTVIDWENILNAYTGTWESDHINNRQDTAVADFVHYIGQSVRMGYGGSSGAVPGYARDALVNYFGFDKRAYMANRGDYSIDQWFDLLYNELDQGYPIFYSGFSNGGGGHSFVIDGYDGGNLFHVNWGWWGSSNGYFLLSILNPGEKGEEATSGGYCVGQSALVNLRIPDGTETEPRLRLTAENVSVTGKSVRCTWVNNSGIVDDFSTGIVKLDDDGGYTLVGSAQVISRMAKDGRQLKTYQLLRKLPEGTYKLSPASKSKKGQKWFPVYNMYNRYIEAVVDSAGVPTLRLVQPGNDIVIDTIICPGNHIAGKEQELKVTFRNTGDEFYREIYLLASQTDTKTYTGNRATVVMGVGESTTVSFYFTPETAGTYNLWFSTDDKGNELVGQGSVEIYRTADKLKANLAVSSVSISNASGTDVYGKRIIGRAVIKNNSTEDFHGIINVGRWQQKIGEGVMYGLTGNDVYVDIAAGKAASISFAFSSLLVDHIYYIPFNYHDQEGSLTNGDRFDHKYTVRDGLVTWKGNGTVAGLAHKSNIMASSTICGLYADCSDIDRLVPNKNPNTIYAFAKGMTVPESLDSSNVVIVSAANLASGDAESVHFVGDNAFYSPVCFEAKTATFTYTFPDTEKGTGWHTFTTPIAADSIFIDDKAYSLGDTLEHVWIYEFTSQDDDGKVVFTPAKELRRYTPYIIAADSTMAGRSVTFRATKAPIYQTGYETSCVSTGDYSFLGTTMTPIVKDCYVLNAEGTAFRYVTSNKTLKGLSAYFTTTLGDAERLASIELPEVPLPKKELVGDINKDSAVDIADAVCVLNVMAEGTNDEAADVNGDGRVDIADFVSILNIMAEE